MEKPPGPERLAVQRQTCSKHQSPLLPRDGDRSRGSAPGRAQGRHAGSPLFPPGQPLASGRLTAARGIKEWVDERLFRLGVDKFSSSPEGERKAFCPTV